MNDLLDRMQRNPAADWTIKDVATLCRQHGIIFAPARGGGSHCKVAHSRMSEKLTIPFQRPIKPIYIRKLVAFVEGVRRLP